MYSLIEHSRASKLGGMPASYSPIANGCDFIEMIKGNSATDVEVEQKEDIAPQPDAVVTDQQTKPGLHRVRSAQKICYE